MRLTPLRTRNLFARICENRARWFERDHRLTTDDRAYQYMAARVRYWLDDMYFGLEELGDPEAIFVRTENRLEPMGRLGRVVRAE